jgi:hypothetical protein
MKNKNLLNNGLSVFCIILMISFYYLMFSMNQIYTNSSQSETLEHTCIINEHGINVYVSQDNCNKYNFYEFLTIPLMFLFLLSGGIFMLIKFKFTPIELNDTKEEIILTPNIKFLPEEKIILYLKDVKFSLKTIGWFSNVYSVNIFVTNKRLIIPHKFIGEIGTFGQYNFFFQKKDLKNYHYFKNNYFIYNWSLDKNKIILYINFTNNQRRYTIYTRHNKEIFEIIKKNRK